MTEVHPRFLYRYRPINEFSLQEILYNTVYICPFEKLNDPLEGGFLYEPSKVAELLEILKKKALADGEFEIALLIEWMSDSVIAEADEYIRQKGVEYLDTRAKGREWGAVCFTERFDNMQMWAHYADGHKGIVIEYDLSGADIPAGALRKVKYTSTPGTTSSETVLTAEGNGQFAETLSYKLPDWTSEEEWRLLSNEVGVKRLLIPVRRVIAGIHATHEAKSHVVNALKRRGSGRFAEMVIDSSVARRIRVHDVLGD